MINPWLKINYSDYENHMLEVGQAQVLSKLTEYFLKTYKPQVFALIGCATGNGLEHIENDITKKVYAIDINQDFLNQTKRKFENSIENLSTYCIDLQNNKVNISNIDLVFCGLILEYVAPVNFLKNICEIINEDGKIVIVIQKNKETSFVTKTKYNALESLSDIAREVSEKNIKTICKNLHLKMIYRDEIPLNDKKKFLVLAFEKNKNI